MTDWRLFPDLTRIPTKASVYEREVYFRQGLQAFQSAFGTDAVRRAHQTAILVVKPDGIRSGKVPVVLEFLATHGFEVLASANTDMSGKTWRELWRYQLTSATLDRLAINDFLFREPALLLLLQCTRQDSILPASVRLSGLKGPSNMVDQADDCLRKQAGQANRILSCVHIADEPADIIREVALLLPPACNPGDLRSMLSGGAGPAQDANIQAAIKSGQDQPIDFDLAAACKRLEAQLALGGDNADAKRAMQIVQNAGQGDKISFIELVDRLQNSRLAFEIWDMVIVGSYAMVYDEPGHDKLIKNPVAGSWDAPGAELPGN